MRTAPRLFVWGACAAALLLRVSATGAGLPSEAEQWLQPQPWKKDTAAPALPLGPAGAFDDTHLLGPCVAFENGRYLLWYCGSRGAVKERVYRLGFATSEDGLSFRRHPEPVLEFGDGRRSILTPALLRGDEGAVRREAGELRLFYAATDFQGDMVHTLHESRSADGLRWSPPSEPLLRDAYAPTVLHDGDRYRLWYTDVSKEPWSIRHAESAEGRSWKVDAEPVMLIDQPWEKGRLFYPHVMKTGGVYLLWYGSYWSSQPSKTAIGFAVSIDGLRWHKHPQNPVVKPDPDRAWESHYNTSHTVLRMPDGAFRIWYASRTKPPFTHKYFAIGTASWPVPRAQKP